MEKYTVVTAITGKKDTLPRVPIQEGVRFVCFTDDLIQRNMGWELLPACDKFDSYLNAKIHKVLIHKYVHTEYSLWVDSNKLPKKNVEKMCETFLKDFDVALYNHSSWKRDKMVLTIEDEVEECCEKRKDDLKRIHEQYKANAYPKRTLPFCGIIFRRHNMQTERLNEKWWSEISRYSVRDQLSFPYVFHDYYEIGGELLEDFEITPYE